MKRIDTKRATASFTLKAATAPEAASFTVSGEVWLEGTEEEVSEAISSAGKEPPAVWKEIYQRSHDVMVALAKLIEVPFSAPKMQP